MDVTTSDPGNSQKHINSVHNNDVLATHVLATSSA